MTEPRYQIELTATQVRILVRATDALTRIGMGQFDKAILDNTHHMPNDLERMQDGREALGVVTAILGAPDYGPNFGPGIYSDKLPRSIRGSWDLCQVLRHRLAWDAEPKGGITTDFMDPLQAGSQPLAKITKIKETT